MSRKIAAYTESGSSTTIGPGITTPTDFGIERQRTKKRHVIRLGGSLGPAMIKNVGPGLTVGTEKIAHILMRPRIGTCIVRNISKPRNASSSRHILGCGDDYSTC